MLLDVERNHRSWFGRGRQLIELDAVTLFLGHRDAVLAFPRREGDLAHAVRLARDSGANEIGCWALRPSDAIGEQLSRLGFQDGWKPHWMGIDPSGQPEPSHQIGQTTMCAAELPYSSEEHASVLGGDVHHFVVRHVDAIVGHAVLNVDGTTGGVYDMGVAPQYRRQGYGRALTLAALACAAEAGCTSVTLNATGEGQPMYRSVGFESLGDGMTWWLFPGRQRETGDTSPDPVA